MVKELQDEADGINVDQHHVKVIEFEDVEKDSLEHKMTATELFEHKAERI